MPAETEVGDEVGAGVGEEREEVEEEEQPHVSWISPVVAVSVSEDAKLPRI